MDFLAANGFCEEPREDVLSCFEYVYEKESVTCMDVYIHVECIAKELKSQGRYIYRTLS